MRKTVIYSAIITAISLLTGCSSNEYELDPITNNHDWTKVNASATIESHDDGDTPYTKSMVDVYSALSVSANFLKIDEDLAMGSDDVPTGAYTFHSKQTGLPDSAIYYPDAYLVNGTTTSAADNTDDHLRDLLFQPDLSYKLRLRYNSSVTPAIIDTLFFYHSRMIGWTPKTKNVPVNGSTQLNAYHDDGIYSYDQQTGKTSVIISDIDLGTDVMFTDLREAQHWHKEKSGEQHYSWPYGYNAHDPHYSNYFTFKHFRSAVRIFAEAEQSQQNLAMWGQITSVQLSGQPTKCTAELPETVGGYPTNVVWSEPLDQDIMTTGMFGDDPNYADLNITAEYPISMSGATSTNLVYLGYAMVEPEKDVVIDLHTTSGVYQVTIPHTNENVAEGLFKASKYYTIKLSLETTGAIAEILEFQSSEHYFDLTALSTMDDSDDSAQAIKGYRYSNCYIVDPKSSEIQAGLTSLNKKLGLTGDDKITSYDGYAFSAIHIGNGDAGIIPTKNANAYFDASGNPTSTIDPASARLVWESSKGMITNVELIHTYVRFKLDSRANNNGTDRLKGNAVIAVYDKNDKLLWSWHVWVTDTPGTKTISNNTFMDRNLGATAAMTTDGASLESYGLYYQWGRKDPSVGPPTYNYAISCLNTATYYDYASDEQNASMIVTESSPTVMTGILNPMYLVLPRVNTDNNWMGTTYTDLWGFDGVRTNKTIYDPCPYGYRVPDNELINATASGTYGTNGYKVADGFYLPYAGFKGDDRGSTTSNLAWGAADNPNGSIAASFCVIGKMGDYQSSVLDETAGTQQYYRQRLLVSNQTSGFDFWIGSSRNQYRSTRTVDFTNRRTAASVRCVKDNTMGGLTADLTFSSKGGYQSIKPLDEITLTYSAVSSGSALKSVTIELQYDVVSDVSSASANTETATQRIYSMDTSSPKVTDKGSVVYTVKDSEFLSKISGNFTFILTAVNEAGKSVRVVKEIGTKEQVPSTLTLSTVSPYTGNDQEVAKYGTFSVTGESNAGGSAITFTYSEDDFELMQGSEVVNGNTKTITLRAKKGGNIASSITGHVTPSVDFTASEASVSMTLITPTITISKDYLTVRGISGKLSATTNTDPAYIRFKSADTTLLTVDNSGNITNNGIRNVAVTVTAYIDGLEDSVYDSCQVVALKRGSSSASTTVTTYWAKATSTDNLDGKTVVLVKDDYMISNSFDQQWQAATLNAFNSKEENYDGYTYLLEKSGDNFVFNSTYNNQKKLLGSNSDTVSLGAESDGSLWKLNQYGTSSFTIQNATYDSRYLYLGDSHYLQSAPSSWGNDYVSCDFAIWYKLSTPEVTTIAGGTNTENAVFSIMQNTNSQNKYMYDVYFSDKSNSIVKLGSQNENVLTKYQYHWVRDTYNGKTYLQNVATGRYIYCDSSFSNLNGNNKENGIKTVAPYDSASNLSITTPSSGTGYNISITAKKNNQDRTLYIVTYMNRTYQTLSLYTGADDRWTFTAIADYE